MKLLPLPMAAKTDTLLPRQNRHWPRFLVSALLAIVIPVLLTEILENLVGIPEQMEWLFHTLVLVAALAPVFYFLWLRPFSAEMGECARAEMEVRRLSRQVIATGEEERLRLARDLHDDFGQKLIALKMQLDLHLHNLAGQSPSMTNECRQLSAIVEGLSDDLRRVVLALRPPLLDDLGLLPAIKAHLADLQKLRPDLEVQLLVSGMGERLPLDLETALFRVYQEALTNVFRHSRARRVEIRLTGCYPTIILIVEDDGDGFDPLAPELNAAAERHFGLAGIRERIAAVGGWVKVQSTPNKGTRLRVEVPQPVKR